MFDAERYTRGFGARVRRQLARRRWTVRDLSVSTELSPGYLYRLVRGEQEPSLAVACAIAEVMGLAVDELVRDAEDGRCPACCRPLDGDGQD